MAFSVEKTGKTVEEAKMAALAELGIREDEADIEIIEGEGLKEYIRQYVAENLAII